jgi:hypothetical protein
MRGAGVTVQLTGRCCIAELLRRLLLLLLLLRKLGWRHCQQWVSHHMMLHMASRRALTTP